MIIEIIVYKNSGKFYTSEVIESDIDIPFYKTEKFKEFIRNNNPANIGEGFIVTQDNGTGFHDALWRYEEIYN